MKVLQIHNRYMGGYGGEDAVADTEMKLLEGNGHGVAQYIRHNDEIRQYGFLRKAFLYFDTTWSKQSYREVGEICRRERPDIAHFHNTLPLISPSAYYACKDESVPIVQTLHNYRLICPGALLMQEGEICEECLGGNLEPSLKHRCYRGSYIQTRAIVRMLRKHRKWGTYDKVVDKYIALTEFARSKFVEGGLPEEKIVVKPNFLIEPPEPKFGGDYAIFVGRLSSEKGVHVLLEAWELLEFALKIAGNGPQRKELEAMGISGVSFLGQVSPEKVLKVLSDARFLVFPSLWYEGFPRTLVEAFASGKPVVASRLGSAAEIVEDGKTGLLFEPGNAEDLAAKAKMLIENPAYAEELGRNARAEFEAKYTAEKNYAQLMKIYEDVIKSRKQ